MRRVTDSAIIGSDGTGVRLDTLGHGVGGVA